MTGPKALNQSQNPFQLSYRVQPSFHLTQDDNWVAPCQAAEDQWDTSVCVDRPLSSMALHSLEVTTHHACDMQSSKHI